MGRGSDPWVWVDLENTPHVLFLEPLIRTLTGRAIPVVVTAKPQAQTLDLAATRGLAVEAVGGGDFAGHIQKVFGGIRRSASLARWLARRSRPGVLVSCSRSASLAAWLLRIPGIVLLDYEHAEQRALGLSARTFWLPDLLRSEALPRRTRRVARFYAGLKENLYLDTWPLDRAATRRALGLGGNEYFVVARPPADTAHYASALSARLWRNTVTRLAERTSVRVVTMPRSDAQRGALERVLGPLRQVEILRDTVAGPELVAAADLVVGGGGTMNREAAVLGVPVWSVFTGPTPYIDECLAREGRLRWVRSEPELASALRDDVPALLSRRGPFPGALELIVRDIEERL
jgi:uncharacterized protein